MNFPLVLKLLGGLFIILSLFLLIPGIFAIWIQEPEAINFFISTAIGACLGCLLILLCKNAKGDLNHRTSMAIVTSTWIAAAILGGLPYYFSHVIPNFVDAYFESISGFSGTGSSVLSNLESLPKSILLWRSMTQWLGGMGIIVFFLAILPFLGVGGVQLFRAETTGPSKDKITPRVHETAKKLWGIYLGLTILLTVLLYFAGMNLFDAVNHSFTTLATGGFSTRGDGIRAFQSPLIDYIIIFFMFICSVNFSLHYQFLAGHGWKSYNTTEVKWYVSLLLLATLGCTFLLWNIIPSPEASFREALFTVVCTSSSTGFTYTDYTLWPVGTHTIIIVLMAMGGMSGSTAGGLKCIRIAAALKQLSKELKRVVHPHGVYTLKVNGQSVPDAVVSTIWGFIFLYFSVFIVVTLILTFEGLDILSASTATFSALSNIGPAFGSLGPYDNFAEVGTVSKLALTVAMLLGRLEFYTVLAIFTFDYWRK
ncbi:MAG: potassium transporter [Bdellovibrionales bacterium]|nr:potassium transporter [Bdellovibrionales bacterium]